LKNFTTHITFASGDSHTEDTPTAKLGSTLERLLTGPAARMGMIKEVKVIDQMDCIVFLAQDNKIVFPAPNPLTKALEKARESGAC
jgi:hypothetical protein